MPTAKYIFLDIDGPLNTGRNDYLDPERNGHHFDDMAVQYLRRIIDETEAKIVVTSSWRHMGVDRIREIWKDWGLPGEIAGCTPGAWGEAEVFDTRGDEIQRWLLDNADKECSFVILDDMDDSEATLDQRPFWIKVDPRTGISEEDAIRAVGVLTRPTNLSTTFPSR